MNTGILIRDARLDAGLTQQELASRAGTSQPAVARYESGRSSPSIATLNRLLQACGLRLVVEVEGARAANLANPIARIARENRERILDAARRRGASNVRMFGSAAVGTATEDSDLDLLVDLDEGRTILDLVGLKGDLETLLGIGVDVAAEPILKDHVRRRALAEAVAL